MAPVPVEDSAIGDVSDVIEQFERMLAAPSREELAICEGVLTLGGRRFAVRLFRLSDRATGPVLGLVVRSEEPDNADGATARRDPLTQLHDRGFLIELLTRALAGNRTGDGDFAVLFIDLDHFKDVNDEYGHLVGDSVIREAARRIGGSVREGDDVVRYGGDEFVAVVRGVRSMGEVEPVIGRVRSALAETIAVPGGVVRLSVSVGVALASAGYATAEEMIAAADRAMYGAKRPEG